jgi:hypothetical protein
VLVEHFLSISEVFPRGVDGRETVRVKKKTGWKELLAVE